MAQLLLLSHMPTEAIPCQTVLYLLRDIIVSNLIVPLYLKISNPSSVAQAILVFLNHQQQAFPTSSHSPKNAHLPRLSTSEVYLHKLAELTDAEKCKEKTCLDGKEAGIGTASSDTVGMSSVVVAPETKKRINVALRECILPSTVHIVKPVPLPNADKVMPDKLSNKLPIKPKKWNKNIFTKSIVDGIKEEDYTVMKNYSKLSTKAGQLYISKSRPNSPARDKGLFVDEIDHDLHRSRSWSSIAFSPEFANEATNSFIAGVCDSSPISSHMHDFDNYHRSASWTPTDTNNGTTIRRRKKRHLIKMNSFDNNDADCYDMAKGESGLVKSASDDVLNYEGSDIETSLATDIEGKSTKACNRTGNTFVSEKQQNSLSMKVGSVKILSNADSIKVDKCSRLEDDDVLLVKEKDSDYYNINSAFQSKDLCNLETLDSNGVASTVPAVPSSQPQSSFSLSESPLMEDGKVTATDFRDFFRIHLMLIFMKISKMLILLCTY